MLSFDCFSKNKKSKDGLKSSCKKCLYAKEKDTQKIYRDKNKEKYSQYNKNWYKDNKETEKEKDKQYYELNKNKITLRKSIYRKNRKKKDPSFRLRILISGAINVALKNNQSSKNNVSCIKNLYYSVQELAFHLENQFESWMTWENQGVYKKYTWKDEDQSTWTWNIDHIIPQSDLPYKNMTEDNFKKCWALDNLRPLSAKQNILDGVNKTRHNNV